MTEGAENLTTRQAEYFMAVYRHMSVSRAAEELFVSRPVISRAISELETELGFPLFIRRSNGIQPTENGTVMWYMLDEFDRTYRLTLERLRSAGSNADAMRLRMGIPNTSSAWFYPNLYRPFHEACPEVTVYAEGIQTEDACEALIDGRLDAAITPLVGQAPPLIGSKLLHTSEVVVCASLEFARSGMKSLTRDECRKLPMAILTTMQPPVFEYNRVITTSQPEMVRIAVASGYAFAMLPLTLVADWDDVLKLPFDPPQKGLVYLLWNKAVPHNKAFSVFMDFMETLDMSFMGQTLES